MFRLLTRAKSTVLFPSIEKRFKAVSLSDQSILDLQAIENLRSLSETGDDSFLKEIINIYVEDVALRMAALKNAYHANDRSLFTRSAHTIKGSSANVGAIEVQRLAANLEHRSKAEELSSLGTALEDLEGAFNRARPALLDLIETK